MADDKKIKQLEKLIAEYERLSKTKYEFNIDSSNLKQVESQIRVVGRAVKDLKDEAAKLDNSFENLKGGIEGIVKEMGNWGSATNKANKAFKNIADITDRLKYDEKGLSELSKKDLETLQKKLKINKEELINAAKSIQNKKKNLGIEQELTKEEKAILIGYEEEFDIVNKISEQTEKRLAEEKKIEKQIGLTGKALDGLKKIPILGEILNIDDAKEDMRDLAKQGKGSFEILGKGLSSAFSGLGPLAIIAGIAKAIQMLVGVMFDADKRITSLSRNLQITKEEAQGVDTYFKSIKSSLETQFKLTKEIYQAQAELSELSALSSFYSKEAIDAQIILTKELKLSVDEATSLNKIFEVNNEKNTDALDTAYNTVAQYANQNKYLFSAQKILSQASKASGQLLVSFKGSSKALFEATLEANKLGTTLEKTKEISDSLLNFEESISAELEAELLTGKDLNLDRARALALQGDYVEATKAALENVGGLAEFQKLLPIQQRALAKAVGMTGDELADVLIQEKLIKQNQKEQYDRFIEAGQERLAQKLAEGKLTQDDIKAANTRLDAQEKFNLALDQAKEVFTDLVTGGTLDKLITALKALADALSEGGSIFSLPERFSKQLEKRKEQEAKQTIGMFNERVKTEGIKKSDLSPQELTQLEEAENYFKRKKAADENYNKNYKPTEKRTAINTALSGGNFAMSGFLGDIIDKQAIKEGVIPVKDYVIKSLPEDTVVGAGGTKLGRTDEMVTLLKELIAISSKQSMPKIYLGTTELNTATSMGTYALNEGVTS
jgi:DNA repair exonuclease SbcCD ATPase subunit